MRSRRETAGQFRRRGRAAGSTRAAHAPAATRGRILHAALRAAATGTAWKRQTHLDVAAARRAARALPRSKQAAAPRRAPRPAATAPPSSPPPPQRAPATRPRTWRRPSPPAPRRMRGATRGPPRCCPRRCCCGALDGARRRVSHVSSASAVRLYRQRQPAPALRSLRAALRSRAASRRQAARHATLRPRRLRARGHLPGSRHDDRAPGFRGAVYRADMPLPVRHALRRVQLLRGHRGVARARLPHRRAVRRRQRRRRALLRRARQALRGRHHHAVLRPPEPGAAGVCAVLAYGAPGFAAALFGASRAGAQCVYIALVTVGYFVFLRDAAPLLPGPYASEVHLCVPRPRLLAHCPLTRCIAAAGRGLRR